MTLFSKAFTQLSANIAGKEDERVWWAKLSGYNGTDGHGNTFANAVSVETQEQYQVDVNVPLENHIARLRSRKVNGNIYIPCLKANEDGVDGTLEEEVVGTEGFHELVKKLACNKGMCKTRYTYPCTLTVDDVTYDLKWEVDVFKLSNGSECEWVKIDLEIPSDVANVIRAKPNGYDDESVSISPFPLSTIDIFEATFGVIDDKDKERANEIRTLVST